MRPQTRGIAIKKIGGFSGGQVITGVHVDKHDLVYVVGNPKKMVFVTEPRISCGASDSRQTEHGPAAGFPRRSSSSGENLGFAGGNNLAIRRAIADGDELVYLLNPDTEAEPGRGAGTACVM